VQFQSPFSAHSAPSDPRELALQAQAGSRAAFGALVERYEAPLFHFLALRANSRAEAEELVQETFLRAWLKLDRYRSEWRFSTWLFTLGRRIAASERRRTRVRANGASELDELSVVSDPSGGLVAREDRAQIWSIAERHLSGEQCSALWLRYAEDLPLDEIARVLGKSAVGVRVLLFRARAKLAQHLDPAEHRDSRTAASAEGGARCEPLTGEPT
jgi:RNA polymerase sigma-70 factor (ECF subfamily)